MKRIIPFLLLVVVCSSCKYINGKKMHGNGNIIQQPRNFSGFTNIDLSSALDVIIKQDPAFKVEVEADANLQEFVEVYTEGETLVIHIAENVRLNPTEKMKVYVSAPVFRRLRVSGASSINKNGRIISDQPVSIEVSGASDVELDLKSPEISVSATGASSAKLTGETRTFEAAGSGSSSIKASGLLAERSNVDLTGASDASVYASVELEADASGASHIYYKGNAAVRSNTSGASSVEKRE